MNERFTIIDYTTDPNGIDTVIDEPVGWDAISLRMKRDKTWHGFFDFVDDSVASLQFVGDGFSILKTAYEAFGAQAKCELLIEFQCAEGDDYDTLYLGRFVFSSYKDECGDECKAMIGVEALDCLMVFRNRYDQQVDLDSLQTFDHNENCAYLSVDAYMVFIATDTFRIVGQIISADYIGEYITISETTSNNGAYTILNIVPDGLDSLITVDVVMVFELGVNGHIVISCLQPYTGLNYPVQLPSKIIQFKNDWGVNPSDYNYTDTLLSGEAIGTTGFYAFPFEWDINVITEINDSYPFRNEFQVLPVSIDVTPFQQLTTEMPAIVKLNLESALRCSGETDIEIVIDGEIELDTTDTVQFDGNIILNYGNDTDGYTQVILQSGFGCGGCSNSTNPISINYSDTITLRQGDSLYINFIMANFEYTSGGGGGGPSDPFELRITVDSASLKIATYTECEPTVCNVYKVNEVMSRCVESYTNDCMRVYSDYFGRVDAQPYPSDVNGCGGQRSIANGKKIRNAPTADGVTPIKMTVSMKDTFEALNATDNIGMGLEDDPFRSYGYGGGYKLLRVEPVNYFFNNDILMICDHIRKVERDVDSALIFSIFKGGFQKWETWNNNGLYDLFGDREYRTELSELSNTLDQTCRWIASDYAIEFTRRLYGTTTSDWRYDDDIFFLCLANYLKYDIGFIEEHTIFVHFEIFGLVSGDTFSISGATNPANNGTFTVDTITWDGDTTTIIVLETVATEILTPNVILTGVSTVLTFVETGVDYPTNILFPETVLNYRIAPSRNAMRWFKTILQSYRTFEDKFLKFTQGGGNILAQGEVLDDDGCRLENQPIQEQQDIELDLFNYQELNIPKFYPELIKFEYPMSYAEYKTVKANPYGLIGYQCGNVELKYGWIEDMQYSPYEGKVNFVLRPKISTDDCPECLLSELGNGLLTEDNIELIEE